MSGLNQPDVQEEIHEMLEGGGDVFTAETHHVLSHVTSEHLIERSRLLRLVVDVLWDFSGDEVGPLQGLDKVP